MDEEFYKKKNQLRAEKERELFKELSSSEANFPWSWYGDRPVYGILHIYLLRIAKPYLQSATQTFIAGTPSLQELERFKTEFCSRESGNYDQVLISVLNFCKTVYDSQTYQNGFSAAEKVFGYLITEPWFYEDLRQKIKHYVMKNF